MLESSLIDEEKFSNIFEKVCNLVSVAETGNYNDALSSLVTLTLFEFENEKVTSSSEFQKIIHEIFSIKLTDSELNFILSKLLEDRKVSKNANGEYILTDSVRVEIESKLDEIKSLEKAIKNKFLSDIECSVEDQENYWNALYLYLSSIFRRHGMQAAALLSNDHLNDVANQSSLTELLERAICTFAKNEEEVLLAKKNISRFMSSISEDEEKSNFIIMLANGAFNYFLLSSDPSASKNMRTSLKELVIFLDTNFLFGILDLHNNIQVGISNNLLDAINKHKLPFKLKYKKETLDEMIQTIKYYGGLLRAREWESGLSSAVTRTNSCSGIELKFHSINKDTPVNPKEFLKPYFHIDELLKEKGIELDESSNVSDEDKKDLCSKYKQFLEDNHKYNKTFNVMFHDASLLAEARAMRSELKSTLEAGTMILSCDYFFYKFDWSTYKGSNTNACVLLPGILWQIIKPYISSDKDWSKSFAATFSLPEFRSIGSNGSKACTKMANILASYKNISEQTAINLLSNDTLLNRLSNSENDKEFTDAIENELINENGLLQEEVAQLQMDNIKNENLYKEKIQKQEQELADKENKLHKANNNINEAIITAQKAQEHTQATLDANKAKDESIEKLARKNQRLSITIALLLGALFGLSLVIGLNLILPAALYGWWGRAVECTIFVGGIAFIVALMVKELRKYAISVLLGGILLTGISLMAGCPHGS